MSTYKELMDLRRMALMSDPPNEALAQTLLEAAQDLVRTEQALDDELKAAQY